MGQLELSEKLATANTGDYSGWSHPHFMRDDKTSEFRYAQTRFCHHMILIPPCKSELELLTPKPSRARMLKKLEKQERIAKDESRRREASLLLAQTRPGLGVAQKVGGYVRTVNGPMPTHQWNYDLSSRPA